MRSGTKRRLGAIERTLRRIPARDSRARLSRLDDAELVRLEVFALRRADWPGTEKDWLRDDLTSDERQELDVLLAKVE